jgi:hypothetical protein
MLTTTKYCYKTANSYWKEKGGRGIKTKEKNSLHVPKKLQPLLIIIPGTATVSFLNLPQN